MGSDGWTKRPPAAGKGPTDEPYENLAVIVPVPVTVTNVAADEDGRPRVGIGLRPPRSTVSRATLDHRLE